MSQSSNTDILTELSCSVCNGFLSCSPVQVLPDGTFVCGQCSPPTNGLFSFRPYRAHALETLLGKALFPCRFAGHGCAEHLVFGQTIEHELKCEYRSFACPFLHNIACSWKGSTSEMSNHITEVHQDEALKNGTLKLEVDQNAEDVATVLKENIVFVVKYHYDAKGTHFTYDIRFCKSDSVLNASYRLQFVNNSDPEHTISLKTVNCAVYDDSFYNSHTVQKLDLNKFFQCLGHPTSVSISVYFTIHSNKNSRKRERDYEVSDYLKCKKCKNCLISPLFQLNKDVFCSDCAGTDKNYLPLNDEKLLETLNTTMFPCRWQKCKFVTENENLKKHQLECQFRQYNCFFLFCEDTFTLAAAANHYTEQHECQYIEKQVSFETSFAECYIRDIITIKKHTIVHLVHFVNTDDCNALYLGFNLSDSASEITGSVHFEHQHCKAKSDSFELIDGTDLKITLDKLPSCFKENDLLTGFLTI